MIVMYTSEDLRAIKEAYMALATGKRRVSVRLSDGSSIQYSEVDIKSLEALYSKASLSVQRNNGTRRPSVVVTSSSGY